jgi:hypothetical protein
MDPAGRVVAIVPVPAPPTGGLAVICDW